MVGEVLELVEWVVAHRAAAADRRAVGYKVVAAGHTVVVGHRVVAAVELMERAQAVRVQVA